MSKGEWTKAKWFDMTSKTVLQWDFARTKIEIAPIVYTWTNQFPEPFPVGAHVRVTPANRQGRRSSPGTFGVIVEVLPSGSYRVRHQVRPKKAPPPRKGKRGWKAEKNRNEQVWRHDELAVLSDLEILGTAFSY